MSETQLTVLLVAVWAGASIVTPVPVVLGLGVVGAGLFAQRPWLLIIGGFVLSLALSARADAAYQPATARPLDERAALVSDPERNAFGWEVEARLDDGSHVLLRSGFDVDMAGFVAGESLRVEGALKPVDNAPWLRVRHVVGTVSVKEAHFVAASPWWMAPSNQIRTWVAASAEPFGDEDEALYTGLVIGDDRFQSDAQQALFRAGGLTHLLAVSGQNVAFALAVVGPLLLRLSVPWRLGATLLVLGVFAIATRFEPSVLRATATAGIAAWSIASGTPASGVRALCLAVSGLILIDPFLVSSVGFQLSVGASFSILVFAPFIANRLRGPGFVTSPLSVTLAAQIGVAPIMIGTFGPVSASTIPANLLAGPAAGAVMTWGLSGGIVAAWMPERATNVVQWPAGLMVQWISGVAGWAARLPLPTVGIHLGVGLLVGAGAWWASAGLPRRAGIAVRCGVGLAVAAGSLAAVPAPPTEVSSYGSLTFYPSVDGSLSVLVIEGAPRTSSLESLIADRVMAVDVVISTGGGYTARQFLNQLLATVEVGSILAPPLHQIRGASIVDTVLEVPVGGGAVVVQPDTDRTRLLVDLAW